MEYKVIETPNRLIHHSICSVDITGKINRVADIPYIGDPTESREQEIRRGIRISNLIMTGEDILNILKRVAPLLKIGNNYPRIVETIERLINTAESKELIRTYSCEIPFHYPLWDNRNKHEEVLLVDDIEETEDIEEIESSVPSTHTEFMLEDLYKVVGDLQKFNRKLLNALIAPVGQQRSNLEALKKELPKEGK